MSLDKGVPVPYRSYNFITPIVCEEHPRLSKYFDRIVDLDRDRIIFRKNLSDLLNSYSTAKALLADVPELSLYFSEMLEAKKNKNKQLVPVALINAVRERLSIRK